jgi:MFS family permease
MFEGRGPGWRRRTLASWRRGKPLYSNGYKASVLGLLLATYTFNFIDRTIIATIGQAIKVDLKLTDTQLGLLGGLYFALLYTLLGIPIARMAERWNRVTIISVSLVIWSGFTALCGSAASFAQLALYRFGVGVGEAGCSPPSHSLISDYYAPKQRASALSIYSFGIPLGTMFGAVAGGWLAQEFSWRVAFVIVGLPGILLAVIVKLVSRSRRAAIPRPRNARWRPRTWSSSRAKPPFSLANEFKRDRRGHQDPVRQVARAAHDAGRDHRLVRLVRLGRLRALLFRAQLRPGLWPRSA